MYAIILSGCAVKNWRIAVIPAILMSRSCKDIHTHTPTVCQSVYIARIWKWGCTWLWWFFHEMTKSWSIALITEINFVLAKKKVQTLKISVQLKFPPFWCNGNVNNAMNSSENSKASIHMVVVIPLREELNCQSIMSQMKELCVCV